MSEQKCKSDPLVSIITPSLNKGQYIEKCLLSIFRQSYRNWEHIVVDGGSTDSTLDIVQNYGHIRLISEPDDGMYDAVNKGINASKGDIIAYLNCDDRYFPETLSMIVEVFRKRRHIDFVYGYCSFINQYEKELFCMRSIPYLPFIFKSMPRFPWSQSSTFWRRDVHEDIGLFNSRFKICGDLDFFFRMINSTCRGELIRVKLSQFMVGNSFAEREAYSQEREKILTLNKFSYALPAKCRRLLGEVLFKASNLDNYLKRAWLRWYDV